MEAFILIVRIRSVKMAIRWICINKDRLFQFIMEQKPTVKVNELFLGQDT